MVEPTDTLTGDIGREKRETSFRVSEPRSPKPGHWFQKSKYGFLWVTLSFFVLTLIGHWMFGWFAYVNEQQSLGAPIAVSDYFVEATRDTLENWQSEFLQLIWQVAGPAFLLYVSSPQSREGEDRKEEKLDAILEAVNPKDVRNILSRLEQKYPKS